jgi:hypothetical protein
MDSLDSLTAQYQSCFVMEKSFYIELQKVFQRADVVTKVATALASRDISCVSLFLKKGQRILDEIYRKNALLPVMVSKLRELREKLSREWAEDRMIIFENSDGYRRGGESLDESPTKTRKVAPSDHQGTDHTRAGLTMLLTRLEARGFSGSSIAHAERGRPQAGPARV